MTVVRPVDNFEEVAPPYDAPRNGNGTTPLRTTGERVPPHDLTAEASLLGAMLLAPSAIDAAVERGLTSSHFYRPAHGHIYAAATALHARADPVDPVTVADELHRDGLLEQVGGPPTLIELQTGTPAISNAPRYATIVSDHARLRALIAAAAEIADLGYSLPDDVNEVVARARALVPEPVINTKETLVSDLQAVMDGSVDPVIPDVAPRDDHATCLLYAPGVNWLSGEPGEGKSMLALWWVAQVIRAGDTALIVDYEGTEQGLVARLREMGVTDVTGLSYVRVTDKWTPGRLAALRQLATDKQFRIAVIDAVAGAMEAEDLDPESNKDVEKWCAFMPTVLANTGAAVVAVDHVAKNKEGRGRWMIGAQRKMARADAAFNLEMFEKAGVGVTGHGKLLVAKDRYGALAPHQAGRIIAEIAIASTAHDTDADDTFHTLTVAIAPPPALGTPGNPITSGPTWYMEQVSLLLEAAEEPMGARELRAGVGRKSKYVDAAVKALAEADPPYIELAPTNDKRTKPWRTLRPYRQPMNPVTVDEPAPLSPSAPSFYETDDDEPF